MDLIQEQDVKKRNQTMVSAVAVLAAEHAAMAWWIKNALPFINKKARKECGVYEDGVALLQRIGVK